MLDQHKISFQAIILPGTPLDQRYRKLAEIVAGEMDEDEDEALDILTPEAGELIQITRMLTRLAESPYSQPGIRLSRPYVDDLYISYIGRATFFHVVRKNFVFLIGAFFSAHPPVEPEHNAFGGLSVTSLADIILKNVSIDTRKSDAIQDDIEMSAVLDALSDWVSFRGTRGSIATLSPQHLVPEALRLNDVPGLCVRPSNDVGQMSSTEDLPFNFLVTGSSLEPRRKHRGCFTMTNGKTGTDLTFGITGAGKTTLADALIPLVAGSSPEPRRKYSGSFAMTSSNRKTGTDLTFGITSSGETALGDYTCLNGIAVASFMAPSCGTEEKFVRVGKNGGLNGFLLHAPQKETSALSTYGGPPAWCRPTNTRLAGNVGVATKPVQPAIIRNPQLMVDGLDAGEVAASYGYTAELPNDDLNQPSLTKMPIPAFAWLHSSQTGRRLGQLVE